MSETIKNESKECFCLTCACSDCGDVPCVWESNIEPMILFSETTNNKEAKPNQQRHSMYRHMTLIINDRSSGRGNRMKLSSCVVAGVKELFPNPAAVYTGHLNKEFRIG
jgi:hypothetical protein